MEWYIKKAEFRRKKSPEEGDEPKSLYADESSTRQKDEEENIWEHRAVFDNEYLYIEMEWEVIMEDEETEENPKDTIKEAMISQHFTLSHITGFMGLSHQPLMAVEEETHHELHQSPEEE